jgi:hypothetical protein
MSGHILLASFTLKMTIAMYADILEQLKNVA